jgi:N utilization substance protein B
MTENQTQETPDRPRDKLDRLAGGRSLRETAPRIPAGPRGARAAALQALYEEDLSGHPVARTLERLPAFAKLAAEHRNLASMLVEAARKNRRQYDRRIESVATEYPVEQIAAVDRNILRIAMAELDVAPTTPQAVVANEAVEMARLFGGDSSWKFVNGVLGALLR